MRQAKNDGLGLMAARPIALGLACIALSMASTRAACADTLAAVRARRLQCGVVNEAADWSKDDVHGNLSPLGIEMCHAVAQAVLGHMGSVEIAEFPAEDESLHALQAGKIDLVVGVTPSVTRATQYGAAFGPPVFWDTQGFMVHKTQGLADSSGLAGKTVCYIDGTEPGVVLLSVMHARHIAIVPFPFQEEGEMAAGLIGGHCSAISANVSKLAELRAAFHAMVDDFVILPDILAVTPVTVATRQDDPVWSAMVQSTIDVLVAADRPGAQSGQAQPATARPIPAFAARLTAAAGSYNDMFDRSVGAGSALGLQRRPNESCMKTGEICAPALK